MKSLSLATRLFLSFSLVSTLLFSGIFFYVKGFSEQREAAQAAESFGRAFERYETLLRSRGQSLSDAAAALAGERGDAGAARAELAASGLDYRIAPAGKEPEVALIDGDPYLHRLLAPTPVGKVELLFPLSELRRASEELIHAFLFAGLALLLLTAAFSHLLAREISRPLASLRSGVRAIASSMGLDAPDAAGDEVSEIAATYLEVARHVHTAYEHKKLALEELEAYKSQLLRANASLQRRFFQVKVLLSVWRERDKALDVKDFLSRFLEALLPGLPFELGCVIIRPLAAMRSETVFARKSAPEAPDEGEPEATRTDALDPRAMDFLLAESSRCMETPTLTAGTFRGSLRAGAPPSDLTVLSFRLQQGEEPLGSVHFLTEKASPQIPQPLSEFLLSLSAQVAAQLQIQALSFATRLDPLTRLYNRGYLNDRLREEEVRVSRKGDPFSLILLEIDDFSGIAERHGPRAADEVLRGLADLLKRSCRGSDAICRLAGAELAIVLSDTPLPGAKSFAKNLGVSLGASRFPLPGGGELSVTASLGLAEFSATEDGVEGLFRRAEQALSTARSAGRGSWKAAG